MNRTHDFLFNLGRPLSPLYSGLMRLRASLYRRGILVTHRLPVPVISIGNLTLGGTGKTPCVIEVVRLLLTMGRRPAVISRGYHGRARQVVNVVSDGREILLDACLAGDEPYLLAQILPGVPVLTGVKRAEVARYAYERFNVDVIVLDDGFQHLALDRGLDLVLFKAPEFLGKARVFPGGRLREPVTALSRAHAFIFTGMDERYQEKAAYFSRFFLANFRDRPVFQTAYKADGLIRLADGAILNLEKDRAMKFCAFCGLADPDSFRSTLARENLQVVDCKPFSDHYSYTTQDMADLVAWAGRSGAEALITTEKDLVKLKGFVPGLPVFALRVRFDLGDDFRRFVEERLTAGYCASGV